MKSHLFTLKFPYLLVKAFRPCPLWFYRKSSRDTSWFLKLLKSIPRAAASSNLFPVGCDPLFTIPQKMNLINLRSCFLIPSPHKKIFDTIDEKLPVIHEGNM